jgi:hypothetical protein
MSSECTVFSCFITVYRLRVSPSHYINTLRVGRDTVSVLLISPLSLHRRCRDLTHLFSTSMSLLGRFAYARSTLPSVVFDAVKEGVEIASAGRNSETELDRDSLTSPVHIPDRETVSRSGNSFPIVPDREIKLYDQCMTRGP